MTIIRPSRGSASRMSLGVLVRSSMFWLMMAALFVTFFGPILWMGTTSLKTYGEATSIPPTLLPSSFDTSAYDTLLSLDGQYPVLRWVLNSLLAATGHMLLVLAVASMAAYALARLQFRGRGVVFALIVSTLFVPGFVFIMPNYLIIDQLGWLNTIWALIVPGAAGAFGVFFLRQFFVAIPTELEEAARSEEHTSELQSRGHLVCRLLLEKNKLLFSYVVV